MESKTHALSIVFLVHLASSSSFHKRSLAHCITTPLQSVKKFVKKNMSLKMLVFNKPVTAMRCLLQVAGLPETKGSQGHK